VQITPHLRKKQQYPYSTVDNSINFQQGVTLLSVELVALVLPIPMIMDSDFDMEI
jgi:hypothetical protein